MRGKRLIIKRWFGEDRITPAGAGKTRRTGFRHEYTADHPRRCGENFFVTPFLLAVSRITPAGAGKTQYRATFVSAGRDHPRRCGENYRSCSFSLSSCGSPPQVRGKLGSSKQGKPCWRITPAGAGKTASICSAMPCLTDHPRRCGENPASALKFSA